MSLVIFGSEYVVRNRGRATFEKRNSKYALDAEKCFANILMNVFAVE